MEQTLDHDKRKFTRIGFAARARLINRNGEFLPAELIDISFKGALVKLEQEQSIALDDIFMLEFILPGSHIVIRMKTKVVHQQHDHFGLVCESIDLESVTHLRRLVELNLGSTALLDREIKHLSLH